MRVCGKLVALGLLALGFTLGMYMLLVSISFALGSSFQWNIGFKDRLVKVLKIDQVSLSRVLYLSTSFHSYCSCNGTTYIQYVGL